MACDNPTGTIEIGSKSNFIFTVCCLSKPSINIAIYENEYSGYSSCFVSVVITRSSRSNRACCILFHIFIARRHYFFAYNVRASSLSVDLCSGFRPYGEVA